MEGLVELEKIPNEFWVKKFLDENCGKTKLLAPYIVPCLPDYGNSLKVDSLYIPEMVFPEEYNKIVEAYMSVMKKLEEHYKNRKS